VFVRVVRFTDVTAERVATLIARIEDEGPPVDVPVRGLQLLFDESQGSAVVIQQFETAEDLRAGGQVFAAMDPSDTPGARVSVDECELRLERRT